MMQVQERSAAWIELQLAEPIPNIPDVIEVLEGNNYARAWWIIQELTRIFGPGGWSFEVRSLSLMKERGPFEAKKRNGGTYSAVEVLYRCEGVLKVWFGDRLIEKGDVGFGTLQGPEFIASKTHENAGKSAATDCLKRCARLFGRRLGNGLYGDPTGYTSKPTVEDLATIGEYSNRAPSQQEKLEEQQAVKEERQESRAAQSPPPQQQRNGKPAEVNYTKEHPGTPPNSSRVDHSKAKDQKQRDEIIAKCKVHLAALTNRKIAIPPTPRGEKSYQLSTPELAAYEADLFAALHPETAKQETKQETKQGSSLNRDAAYKRILDYCGELGVPPVDGYESFSDEDLIAYGQDLQREVRNATQDM